MVCGEFGSKGTHTMNLFTRYKKEENHYTNGLIAILSLSTLEDPKFLQSFFEALLNIPLNQPIVFFRVLEGIDGSTVDAELCGEGCCIRFETKIKSAALDAEQTLRHAVALNQQHAKLKRLILLTPDDRESKYVKKFLGLEPGTIIHLQWRRVYDYLDESIAGRSDVFSAVVQQFLDHARENIFKMDIAGIIMKVSFGKKSGVSADHYLTEMTSGEWTHWNTPSKCQSLDGTGRKLLLYDKTREAITVEAEIEKVIKAGNEVGYPWTNYFAPGKVVVFPQPIPLARINAIQGFANFRKERAPYRNLTHEQYAQVMFRH
jgi:hypothetical protein